MLHHRFTVSTLAGAFLAFAVASGPAHSQSCTGDTVTVQRGDTLSRLADRCDVSESTILAANPDIDGSRDLEAGQRIRLRRSAPEADIVSNLNSFATEAGDALGRVADKVGASVQDLLDKNPDLRARLDKLGENIGLTGEAIKPTMAVTPDTAAPGSTVTVSGVGWPKESSLAIGAGAPGSAYEVLQTIRTSSNGTFDVSLRIPSWATANDQIVFTAKAGEARARSERLSISH